MRIRFRNDRWLVAGALALGLALGAGPAGADVHAVGGSTVDLGALASDTPFDAHQTFVAQDDPRDAGLRPRGETRKPGSGLLLASGLTLLVVRRIRS